MTLGDLKRAVRSVLAGDNSSAEVTRDIAEIAYRDIARMCEPLNLVGIYDPDNPPADLFRKLQYTDTDDYGNTIYYYVKRPAVSADEDDVIDIDPVLENALILQVASYLSSQQPDRYLALAKDECYTYDSLMPES